MVHGKILTEADDEFRACVGDREAFIRQPALERFDLHRPAPDGQGIDAFTCGHGSGYPCSFETETGFRPPGSGGDQAVGDNGDEGDAEAGDDAAAGVPPW